MKGKYFSTGFVRTSTPVINQIGSTGSDAAFADKDIVFDWVAIDIPKGTHRLISADMIVQGNHGARQAEVDFQLWFARPIDGVEPASLGTPNAAITGTGHRKNMLGVLTLDLSQSATDTFRFNSYYSSSSYSSDGLKTAVPGIIVDGEKMLADYDSYSSTDTLEGFIRIYVAGITMGALNFSTNILLNQGSGQAATTTETTLSTDGAQPTKVFEVGDTIAAMDGAAIGTITALTTTSITVDKCTQELADDDEILTTSPIRVKLGFEQ